MTRRVEAGLIDMIVDVGDKVYDIAESIPGQIGWVATLGRMTLSKNKYVRAFQILGTATGLTIAPMAVYYFVKNLMGGDEVPPQVEAKLKETMMKALQNAQAAKAQAKPAAQQAPAAVAASIRDPKLKARLIRVAQSVRLLEQAQRITNGNGKITSQLGDGVDILVIMASRSLRNANLLTDVGEMVAPRATQKMEDWAAEAEDEDLQADMSAEEYDKSMEIQRESGHAAQHRRDKERAEAEDEEGSAACADNDSEACGMDDGSYPAGPRSDPDQSRYQVQPAHGQSTVDLLRFTAQAERLISRLENVAHG